MGSQLTMMLPSERALERMLTGGPGAEWSKGEGGGCVGRGGEAD